MQKREAKRAEITAESLQLDVPPAAEAKAGEPGVEQVVTSQDEAAPTAPSHADIGNWQAVYWRGRPMWRHKRTGQTLFKRADVRRNRNLK